MIGIFLGAVWAYILLFTFVGPEMSQGERDEEAEAVLEYERMRAQGVSLAEIGAGRAKGMGGERESEERMEEVGDGEKGEPETRFVEKV